MTEKIPDTSADIRNENLEKLREVFPQFVSENTIDFDALQKFFEREGILADTEKYGLNWAGKSNAFRAIRTPATGTLVPQMDESKNWDETENIFIEGDNLEVLKLLQKHYANPGKIKMIYIDPPYNTGKDFVYKDNFTQGVADYYEQTGQTQGGIKMTTNTEKNGRYHSDWLTMMYPRLFLARNLLRDDGVIFVSIDDNEVANLRLVMDEIFGEENFVANLIRKRRDSQANLSKNISPVHEYVLIYAKNNGEVLNKIIPDLNVSEFKNPDNDPRGPYVTMPCTNKGGSVYEIKLPNGRLITDEWRFKKETFENLILENKIVIPRDGQGKPRYKLFFEEKKNMGVLPSTWLDSEASNQEGTKEIKDIFEDLIFDTPKPVGLLKFLLKLASDDSSIILDFFAGSGTTAHAVMDLNAEDDGNRKWICVQLPEETDEKSEAYKAGYKNIAEISRERIRRAGDKIGKGDVGFKSFKLSPSNYRKWNEITDADDVETLLEQSKLFIENPLIDNYDEQSVVYEILEKEGFGLNAKIEQLPGDLHPYMVTENDRKLVVTFEKQVSKEQVENLKLSLDDTFVCFDSALDDTGKVNIGRVVSIKTI